MTNDFTWKIGGEAGFGIMASGLIFSKFLAKYGFHIFAASEYPSLIRGGHNTVTVRASSDEVSALKKTVHFLVALNKETIDFHKEELVEGAGIIYDSEDFQPETANLKGKKLFPIPLLSLARKAGGDVLMRNTVALGATAAVLDLDFLIFKKVLQTQFKAKGEKVVDDNLKAAFNGYHFIKKNFADDFKFKLKKTDNRQEKIVLSGNEAMGLGALAAEMKFFAGYPMTPINGLITFLAAVQEKMGFIYKQPEDEIAGINMAIGASFAGARSMTATSGGGFSLMTEALSMAGMTETPLVVILGTRPGPSTGLATCTGQGDLKFALSAGQGEFLRIVLAPADVKEAFYLTQKAFHLAEIYQTPVIILADKFLCESFKTIEEGEMKNMDLNFPSLETKNMKKPYKRYQITPDGISPRIVPGIGVSFTVNSYEHNEEGFSTEEPSEIIAMVEKRKRKWQLAEETVPLPEVFGDRNAPTTIVSWGSTKGTVREALKELKKTNHLHLNFLNPFPRKAVGKILLAAKRVVIVENNSSGQLKDYISEQIGFKIEEEILKYDGRPFLPEEIIEKIES